MFKQDLGEGRRESHPPLSSPSPQLGIIPGVAKVSAPGDSPPLLSTQDASGALEK